jgi:hypothetical protein
VLNALRNHTNHQKPLLVCQLGDEFIPLGRLAEIFFTHAPAYGLLCRPEGNGNVSYLLQTGGLNPADFEALGQLRVKCLLDGVAIPVELSAAVLCFVLNERELTVEQLLSNSGPAGGLWASVDALLDVLHTQWRAGATVATTAKCHRC